MSTPYNIDKRLQQVNLSLENLAEDLVHVLSENYTKGNLESTSVIDSSIRENALVLTDSEFENVLLTAYYNGRYFLKLESRGSDSPYILSIDLDECLVGKFPEKMRTQLEDSYYDSLGLNE